MTRTAINTPVPTYPQADPGHWPREISIIGAAGMVGSSVAAQLVLAGVGQNIYLQDQKHNVLESHWIDLNDTQALLAQDVPKLHLGEPPSGEVDLVIVAASMAEVPDGDRRAFLAGNTQILSSLADQLQEQAGKNGTIMLLSNPVDVLADWFCAEFSFDEHRLIGYALNDTARFQLALAHELEVPVSQVEAVVYGEHGRGQVPILSSVRVHGQPRALTAAGRERVLADVEGWFARWSSLRSGRSSGWATGAGVVRLIQQLAAGERVVTTASTADIPDLERTFMALPVQRVEGTVTVERPSVNDSEFAQLINASHAIRESARELTEGVTRA